MNCGACNLLFTLRQLVIKESLRNCRGGSHGRVILNFRARTWFRTLSIGRLAGAFGELAPYILELIIRQILDALCEFAPYILKSVHRPGCYQPSNETGREALPHIARIASVNASCVLHVRTFNSRFAVFLTS